MLSAGQRGQCFLGLRRLLLDALAAHLAERALGGAEIVAQRICFAGRIVGEALQFGHIVRCVLRFRKGVENGLFLIAHRLQARYVQGGYGVAHGLRLALEFGQSGFRVVQALRGFVSRPCLSALFLGDLVERLAGVVDSSGGLGLNGLQLRLHLGEFLGQSLPVGFGFGQHFAPLFVLCDGAKLLLFALQVLALVLELRGFHFQFARELYAQRVALARFVLPRFDCLGENLVVTQFATFLDVVVYRCSSLHAFGGGLLTMRCFGLGNGRLLL